MKKIILLASFWSVCLFGFSQSWETVSKTNDLLIEKTTVECHDNHNGIHQEVVLLRFENLTNNAVSVSYDLELYYNGVCKTCTNQDNELRKTISIKPGEVFAGTCDQKNRAVRIFSKFLDIKTASLTDFNIKNIEVVVE